MNGAGKTTMLRLAAGLLSPNLGSVTVYGRSPRHEIDARKMIGLCPEIDRFYEKMTGHAWVAFMARLSGLGKSLAKSKAESTLVAVGMAEFMHKKIGACSKGMRQKIKLARALVHDPRLLLLDEPLTGLDPVARHEMVQLIKKLGRDGCAVLVSSHVLSEIELMTHELILIHQGRLMAQGDLTEIRAQIRDQPGKVELSAREPREVAARLMSHAVVESIHVDDQRLVVQYNDSEEFFGLVTDLGLEERLGIETVLPLDSGLDAVFDYLVKK